ncbi:hypothetical protein yberc0001_26720 [Yersinia bercovieri ATCC 43970]|uniref:Uncharacterized protein n=1 Tax=Yersinia bercovieri ATCC 43970 TaxID=349968 RepID=A0ABM9XXR5_YERBE|nr:hypothetical protein yberc0001_26720 [Yersinia bercovieri ATCC 43970]
MLKLLSEFFKWNAVLVIDFIITSDFLSQLIWITDGVYIASL